MPHGRRDGPAGDLRVGNRDRVRQLVVGEPTEPAPEDDADSRLESGLLSNARNGVLDAPSGAHVEPSARRALYLDTIICTAWAESSVTYRRSRSSGEMSASSSISSRTQSRSSAQ